MMAQWSCRGMFAVAAVLLAACQASADTRQADAMPAPAPDAGGPARSVDILVAAAQASDSGDVDGLRQALFALDALGLRADDPQGAAMLASWAAVIPGDVPPLRGRALGPAFRAGEVASGGAVEIEQTFLAGQSAAIAVRARNGHDLKVKVFDGGERTLCTAAGERVQCRWTPPYTQRHVIRIDNPQRTKVRYFISFI